MKEFNVQGTISSITELLRENASDFNGAWFRGHSNYSFKLLPSIFRQGSEFNTILHENKMFEEFKRRYPDQSFNHKTTFEWLTLMQHYGLPTRLLDWSTNLLVSLYFCCSEDLENDGALFVLNPTYMERDFHFNELLEMQVQEKSRNDFFNRLIYKMEDMFNDDTLLNSISFREIKKHIFIGSKFSGLSTGSKEEFISLEIKQDLTNTINEKGDDISHIYQDCKRAFSNIVPFKAPHLNPRIKQQHGYFTFHGGMYIDGQEFIPVSEMEKHPYSGDSLIKIKISAKDKINILKELEYAGIREATLFPEMEYQAKEIKDIFTSPLGS
ncbi:FRG domain-containing protein [Colwellia sp. RSH04]|uniref:FRG domain-containing protein n=1 Tax=Colwellia sp. RSH04 TaxID=2305464 RepID=UPI000E5799E6|nr:FRG domain-containing protein [Colwellia sp. RSH04]RHW74670.1 FRG domain-containing protein [Colwellia sp. RSH04]